LLITDAATEEHIKQCQESGEDLPDLLATIPSGTLIQVCQPDLTLFRVCRQILKEASSTFYSNNTFTLTRIHDARAHQHDVNGARIMNAAVSWLDRIGSRAHLLRKVEVDLDTLCPPNCRYVGDHREYVTEIDQAGKGMIDITPLLGLVWTRYPALQLSLVFVHNTVQDECKEALDHLRHGQTPLDRRTWPSVLCEPTVKDTFQLLRQDSLGIKKFWPSILSIGLSRDGLRGVVVWSTAPKLSNGANFAPQQGSYMDHASRFLVNEAGNVQWQGSVQRDFFTLPRHLRTRILKSALVFHNTQIVSSSNASTIDAAMDPLHVGEEVSSHHTSTYKNANKFIIELKATESASTLPDLDEVSDLLWKIQDNTRPAGTEKDNRGGTWPNISYWPSARITILFDLKTLDVTDLKDVCFEAMPFLRTTLKLHAYKKINIRLVASDSLTGQVVDISKAISISVLRRNALDAWSLLDPESATEYPKIWINGLGEVVKTAPEQSLFAPPDEDAEMHDVSETISHSKDPAQSQYGPKFPGWNASVDETYTYLKFLCRCAKV